MIRRLPQAMRAVPRVNAMGILRGIRLGMLAAQNSVAVLSPAQIQAYATAAGFTGDDLATAVAIALAESSGSPNAIGDKTLAPTAGPSYGLWQINIGSRANPQFASENLFDPQTNANAAYAIYSAWGGNFNAWSTYTSGKYQAYLGAVPAAAPASSPAITLDASSGQPVNDLTDVSQLAPVNASVAAAPDSTIVPGIPDVAIYGGAALAAFIAAHALLNRD